MKIKEKIIIAFGFYFLITAIVGLLVYRELATLDASLMAADRAKNLLLFGMATIFATGAAVSLHLARHLVMPITRLKNSAKKISMGDFSAEIDVSGNDEMTSLSRSIDSMQVILKNVLQSLDDSMKELREKQSQLLRAEKLAAIGVFASGMAHEINNPLTSVLTFSNLILEKMPDDDPRREMLRIMSRDTMRARSIVKQLLSFAKDAPINPRRFDINAGIKETVHALSLQGLFEGIDIRLNLNKQLPDVSVDPLQIEELFSNMLLNAVQAIIPPGTIALSTAKEGGDLKIVIADTGKGIPAEYIDKIFDPFFTTKGTVGTGLGLAVSYDIIKKHRGDIEVTSKVNGGTSFIIKLPIYGQDQGISS
jgi:two-component system, NtrC family, sensor kinase